MNRRFMAIATVGTVALAAAMSTAPMVASAASATGSIRGKVVSVDSGATKGMTVTLWTPEGKEIAVTTTNSNGRYKFTSLKADTYTVKFQDKTKSGLFRDGGYQTHYLSEWLGDEKSRNHSTRIQLSAGELVNDANETIFISSVVDGKVFINGRPAKYSDKVIATVEGNTSDNGTGFVDGGFSDNVKKGVYTVRISSKTGAFEPFYVKDPKDGDTKFAMTGINSTDLTIRITTGL